VFNDVPLDHPNWAALQYFGTKGFFPTYDAKPDEPLTTAEMNDWLNRAAPLVGRPINPDLSGQPMTRGQFCQWLYDCFAWISRQEVHDAKFAASPRHGHP